MREGGEERGGEGRGRGEGGDGRGDEGGEGKKGKGGERRGREGNGREGKGRQKKVMCLHRIEACSLKIVCPCSLKDLLQMVLPCFSQVSRRGSSDGISRCGVGGRGEVTVRCGPG